MKKNILIINGPNLNLLGQREPEVYGKENLNGINEEIKAYAQTLNAEVTFFQSNFEGEIIDCIHNALGKFNGIVINPAAYTHYSLAIRDAIASVNIPAIEVHLSNVYAREEFRHSSVIAPVCKGQISGLGKKGYFYAINALLED